MKAVENNLFKSFPDFIGTGSQGREIRENVSLLEEARCSKVLAFETR